MRCVIGRTAALSCSLGCFATAPIAMTWTATAGWLGPAPKLAALFAVGAFASLGLPEFSGFIAEFQIVAGTIATTSWPRSHYATMGWRDRRGVW